MNRYPGWKYALIVLVVLFGTIYALPNLFGEDPAVQISPDRGDADTALLDKVQKRLDEAQIEYKRIGLEDGLLLARFDDPETQLKASEMLRESLGSDYLVALNLAPNTPDWLKSLNAAPMSLGLDLRGGVHFLMEVDMEFAVDKALERFEEDLKISLRADGGPGYRRVIIERDRLRLQLREPGDLETVQDILDEKFQALTVVSATDDIVMVIGEEEKDRLRKIALEQNITVLRNRVNELGVAEPLVQQQGANRVVVELPGIQDTAQAKKIIGSTATVEFHGADTNYQKAARAKRTGRVPPGLKLYEDNDGLPVLLKRSVIASGSELTDASAGPNPEEGRYQVNVQLDEKGGGKMREYTSHHIGDPMAVVFIEYDSELTADGERKTNVAERVINVATIQAVLSRRFRITGLEQTEAREVALLLRAGALAAPVYIVEERTIGPSMGQDNIDQGFMSVMIGFALVVFFMILYYRLFGFVANLALFMNLVLIIGVMSLIQATLTLPGIAGIVLTVGMAVDANVLIFERIREELRGGSSPQNAISAGYDRAFMTIADANITTLIAAAALAAIGAGPIRGFAITLSIGILTSMFTAIIGTRGVINLIYGGRRVEKLSI